MDPSAVGAKDKFIEQLIASFEKKKWKKPSYSWRLLASQLGISHAFLSNVLNEKKSFPLNRLDLLIELLELDAFGKRRLLSAFLESRLNKMKEESSSLNSFLTERLDTEPAEPSVFSEIPHEKVELFQKWYLPVVLDLVPTANFKLDFEWISKTIGISKYEATWAWQYLESAGLVIKDASGRWCKVADKLRMPTGSSLKQMQLFYKQIFSKAQTLMETRTDDDSFRQRLIMGVTCSVNPESWLKVKSRMEDQLYSNAETLAEGTCEEVYALVTLAIPLTQSQ